MLNANFSGQKAPTAPRHARLFELIRQQNLASANCSQTTQYKAEMNDAQSFVEAAQNSLRMAS